MRSIACFAALMLCFIALPAAAQSKKPGMVAIPWGMTAADINADEELDLIIRDFPEGDVSHEIYRLDFMATAGGSNPGLRQIPMEGMGGSGFLTEVPKEGDNCPDMDFRLLQYPDGLDILAAKNMGKVDGKEDVTRVRLTWYRLITEWQERKSARDEAQDDGGEAEKSYEAVSFFYAKVHEWDVEDADCNLARVFKQQFKEIDWSLRDKVAE